MEVNRKCRVNLTCIQQVLASSVNFDEYVSVSSFTRRSTSSRFTFSFLARNGAYNKQLHCTTAATKKLHTKTNGSMYTSVVIHSKYSPAAVRFEDINAAKSDSGYIITPKFSASLTRNMSTQRGLLKIHSVTVAMQYALSVSRACFNVSWHNMGSYCRLVTW